MPTFDEQYPGGWEALRSELVALIREVNAFRQRPFTVPVLDADPLAGDPTNLWLLNDGRLRARDAEGRIREWVCTTDLRPHLPTFTSDPAVSTGWRFWLDGNGNLRTRHSNDAIRAFSTTTPGASGNSAAPANGPSTSADLKPIPGQPNTYQNTYPANAAMSYDGIGAQIGSNFLQWGRDGVNGGYKTAWIGFDDSTIRTDLDGAVIRSVEFLMAVQELANPQGTDQDVRIIGSNDDTAPALGTGVTKVPTYESITQWRAREAKWVTLPVGFGEALRDNLIKALLIDQAVSSLFRTGYASGVPSGTVPQLRITFTK